MFEIDLQAMKKYADNYLLMVAMQHGDRGSQILHSLLDAIVKIYEWVEPQMFEGPITIFKTLDEDYDPISTDKAITLIDLRALAQETCGFFAIQVLGNEQFLLWRNCIPDTSKLAQDAIVYRYQNRTEEFFAKDESRKVLKLDPSHDSMFSRKTFSDLRIALEEYKIKMVRYSSCRIFSQAWRDKNRLFFVNGPEHIMRDALVQFLKSALRDNVQVLPEQNVDETKPVDVKVTWMNSNRVALLEIKWMGKSKKENGQISATHNPSSARKGASQLANYLDRHIPQAPDRTIKGYLVIFDGRRYGTSENTESVSRHQGLYYKDKEIDFNPKYHEIRTDFETPIRMFAEPVCQ